MRTRLAALVVVGVAVVATVGCSKSGEPDKAAAGSSGTARDAVIRAWTDAKLTPSAMTTATVSFGKDCQTGAAEGIDVVLCNFASAAEAKAAEDQGLIWIGQATGASQAHGTVLIVLADRRKADPSGRTINRLLKLAPN